MAAALAEIDKASDLAKDLDDNFRARAKLARAYYYYRAEMNDREFPVAIQWVEESLANFSATGDLHGQAEAVHLRGLIHLQMQELELARQRFDDSLELDQSGGQRTYFLGEYERHVAFVFIFQGSPDLAVPHLDP